MRTYSPKASEITRAWHVVDAEGLVLGRMATEVARILRGKHKPTFAPHIDTGDHVIIINADKVVLTAGKAEARSSTATPGYPGGIKHARPTPTCSPTKPEEAVRRTIRGMLPKNRLGRQMLTQAQGLRRPDPPARSPAARRPSTSTTPAPGSSRRTEHRSMSTAPRPDHRPPQARRRPRPRSVRAPARSRSTSARSRTTSRSRHAPHDPHRAAARSPSTAEVYDVDATIDGGGVTGQAGALRLGIARALIALDAELRAELKKAGFLTRDAREKESKKYGLKKARKAPQYSKR